MHKIVIAATLFSSSLAYANDIVVLGSPMDVVQKPATLEALSREVAGINPALIFCCESVRYQGRSYHRRG
jgi:hypothetical protein